MSSANMSENKKLTLENDLIKKIHLTNNKKLIKIMTFRKSTDSQSCPILTPCSIPETKSVKSVSPIILKQHITKLNSASSRIISASINNLNSETDIKDPKTSTDTNIFKNQNTVVNNESLVTVPNSTNRFILKVDNASSKSTSLNVTSGTDEEATSSQYVFIPQKKKQKIEYDTDSNNTSTIETRSNSSSSSNNELDQSKLISDQLDSSGHSNSKQSNNIDKPKLRKTSKSSIAQIKHMEDKRFKKMNILLLKQLKLNKALREKITLMSCTIRRLIKHHSKDYKRFLYDVFNPDQLRCLELKHTNPKSIVSWSEPTMKRAAKLKVACGNRGYEELLNQNMPLPSIRTISRWCNVRNLPIP